MINSIKATIGTTNQVKISATRMALKKVFPSSQIDIISESTDSGVSSQPLGLSETKRGAINRMTQCFPTDPSDHITFAIGMENGLVPGIELNQFQGTLNYSEDHWYDIGICAVTVFKSNCAFKYVSYAEPLIIPNSEDTGFLPPSEPEKNIINLSKYQSIIMPILEKGFDLYQWFSEGTLSRESTLAAACKNAIDRLSNITVLNLQEKIAKISVVIMFGTFDLFHDLHKRLIDCASYIGDKLVIYIYNKLYKSKSGKKDYLTHDIQTRITNVVHYAARKGKAIVVHRMKYSHPEQLRRAISEYSLQGNMAVFGGDDQFSDYDRIINICFENSVPIITINRGETKLKLCSSDLREKSSYKKIGDIYHLDLARISPQFWKNRIRSHAAAKEYLQKINYLGLEATELWLYQPTKSFDKKITKLISIHESDKIIVCLPGRKLCNLDRMRKIAATIDNDYVKYNSLSAMPIYVCCYEQTEFDTGYHLRNFVQHNLFGDDAMVITKTILLPCVGRHILVEKIENLWCVEKISHTIIYSISTICENLSKIVISARSLGSVVAIEMELALKYCMLKLGFSEEDIVCVSRYVSVISICNLVGNDRARQFTTISFTGINDKIAQKYINNLSQSSSSQLVSPAHYIDSKGAGCDGNRVSNHYSVLATIPEKIIAEGTNLEISDTNCHYTPLFTTIRRDSDNTLPLLVRHAHKLVLENALLDLPQRGLSSASGYPTEWDLRNIVL